MDSIRVQGGIALQGKVRIQGSKNASLPIMAASLMAEGPVFLENCPKISDVYRMQQILECLGCSVSWEGSGIRIDSRGVKCGELPAEAVKGMRSSLFLLGALLARCGRAGMDYPGGCVIGKRPIDIHIRALEALGTVFRESDTGITASAAQAKANELQLDFPSVGATENAIMLASAADGTSVIRGAAKEPEVQALCEFLNKCGAAVAGIGTDVITVEGGKKLSGCSYRIPSDRIVAGTYLLSGFTCGGSAFLESAPWQQMASVLSVAEEMGAALAVSEEGIYVQWPDRAGKLMFLETDVYPGFPTDLQSIFLAVRCTGEGTTYIREKIFENRFRIVDPLLSMGADIVPAGDRQMKVRGVYRLHGMEIEAKELRGGAALTAAALGAAGETVISGRRFIDRGYENIARDLRELGARISSG